MLYYNNTAVMGCCNRHKVVYLVYLGYNILYFSSPVLHFYLNKPLKLHPSFMFSISLLFAIISNHSRLQLILFSHSVFDRIFLMQKLVDRPLHKPAGQLSLSVRHATSASNNAVDNLL